MISRIGLAIEISCSYLEMSFIYKDPETLLEQSPRNRNRDHSQESKMKEKTGNYTRCPWCGKQPVKIKRGRLSSHLNPGGVKCFAIGQTIEVCKNLESMKTSK